MLVHPTDDYDVLVRLDASVLPRYSHNVAVDAALLAKSSKYANAKHGDEDAVVRPAFDLATMLFDDLQV